ncbi:hypothetical protein [Nocardia sp. CC227C]|uniref:hypothetical protein n=1 Tax=Nocardia sp. CC227C TaxID=3044562 RepID=UPI00278C5DCD|nr:hypothetical protein [Nocardia sp. CC227C]
MLDGRAVKYTIPEGNGNNTVDLEIMNPDGTVDRWRIARNAQGGLQHWHDDADGNSSYAVKLTADSDWSFQTFLPGTSTSGLPSRVSGATTDLSKTYQPEFDEQGRYIGVSIGDLKPGGLYDNQFHDLYNNVSFNRTVVASMVDWRVRW